MSLPLTPWWYHPSHRYEGRHRGTYPYGQPVRITHMIGTTHYAVLPMWVARRGEEPLYPYVIKDSVNIRVIR